MVASKTRYMIYGFALAFALMMYPFYSYSAQGCGTLKGNIRAAMVAGFAPLFTAITDRNMPIMVVVSNGGDWIIFGIDEQQNACALAKGSDLKLIIERSL